MLFVLKDTASKCIDLDDTGVEDNSGSGPAIQDWSAMKHKI